ncbi:hypothetical protein SOVF_020580 [Spinacia oleracea]|nr:hypothetical protein SOVF_020580 [Spinacia oleracea]
MMLKFCLFIFFTSLGLTYNLSYGYDPLDVRGNVTIQWDITDVNPDTYNADVTIYNYQQYRHIEWPPGWRLSWEWQNHEVIWNMQGAEAKEQGICNKSLGASPPHCCLKQPVIIDLQPGSKLNKQAANCCKGGVLTSMAQDPTMYASHFQMTVGLASTSSDTSQLNMPNNFKFGTPGYTCGDSQQVFPPTKFPEDDGRRWRQALNDTGLFWGIQHYNDVLLQSGLSGNVQSELLLRKVPGTFTFDAGWAFPKRIYFNGENCVMPLPVDFPRLPKETSRHVRQ